MLARLLAFGGFSATMLLISGCLTLFPELEPESKVPAYTERMAEAQARFAQEKPPLDATLHYTPGVTSAPRASEIVIDASGAEIVRDQYLVVLKAGATDLQLFEALKTAGIRATLVGYVPTFGLVELHATGLTPAQKLQLARLTMVEWFAPERIQKANQTPAPSPGWFISDLGISEVQKVSRGKGVRVAVIDTGVDVGLASLKGRIVDGYSAVTLGPNFEDEVFGDRNDDDTRVVDHGTRVASMIHLVAPEADIMPIQVFGFRPLEGVLFSTDAMILEGVGRAIAYGAKIINLSLGTDYSRYLRYGQALSGDLSATLKQVLEIGASEVPLYRRVLLECQKRDILVVVSAGNEGVDAKIQPLVASGLAIAVGAVERGGHLAGFSNRGDSVDSYAPGAGVELEGAGGTRFAVSGTSFSAPFVAGVLADIRSSNLKFPASQAAASLRATNLRARLSILPDASDPVFYPTALLRSLGARVSDAGTLLSAQAEFKSLWGSYFLNETDSSQLKIDKIIRWYAARGSVFSYTEREFRAAAALRNDNLDFLMNIVTAGKNGDYIAAMLLRDATIPPAKLSTYMAQASASDYVGLIASGQGAREAVPFLNQRLAGSPLNFNSNTLYALREFGDATSVPFVKSYLDRTQKEVEFWSVEIWTCTTLAALTAGQDDAEAQRLIAQSVPRFYRWAAEQRNSPDRLVESLDEMIAMFRLLEARQVKGLMTELVRLVQALDTVRLPASWAGTPKAIVFDDLRQSALQDLGALVNRHAPADKAFSYLADPGKKAQRLSQLLTWSTTFTWPSESPQSP